MLYAYSYKKKLEVQFKINGKDIADAADVTYAAWKFLHKWRWFETCGNRMKVCLWGIQEFKNQCPYLLKFVDIVLDVEVTNS